MSSCCEHCLRQICAPQGSATLPKGRLDKQYKKGVMFITYSLLIAALKKATLQTIDDQNVDTSNGSASDLPDPRQQGVLPGTRLFQVVEWLTGADKTGNCLIILDECHKAKNLIAREGKAHLALLLLCSASGCCICDNECFGSLCTCNAVCW